MNRAKKILEFVTPHDKTDRYGSRVGVLEKEPDVKYNRLGKIDQSPLGFDVKQVVREYAMSVLNVNYDKAESFAMEVAKHIADGDWLEIHIPGHSVQWDRKK